MNPRNLYVAFFICLYIVSVISCKKNEALNEAANLDNQLCSQVNKLAIDTSFKTRFKELVVDSRKGNMETGYVFSEQDGIKNYSKVTGIEGEPGIEISHNKKIDGYIHCHYGNLFPIFSGSDLKSIYDLHLYNKLGSPKSFTIGVTSAVGTAYLLKIRDFSMFLEYGGYFFADQENFRKFEKDYEDLVISYSAYGRIAAHEIALLKMIENSGLVLYRGNLDFDKWDGIYLKGDGIIGVDSCR